MSRAPFAAAADDDPSAADELSRLRARIAELEATVRRDEGAVAALFGTLSHELRSPLQSLLLNIGICGERMRAEVDPVPGWLPEKLDKQRRLAERLKLLIDTFLNVGQIAAGRLESERHLVDLGELAGDVSRRMSDELAWAGCRLSAELPPGVTGLWDQMQLDLVVTNLLSNAMKYGAGRPIEMAVWEDGGQAFLRVTDHGPGIPRADHRRIFEKFTRLATTSRVSGFGLGLWIVAHLVQAFGGTVAVESDVGRGASFLVSLPCQPR
jgi:signal transduction histidine kinase